MIGRKKLSGGVAPLALHSALFAGGILLAHVTAVAPAHAAACTTAVDGGNETTCIGGTTGGGNLTYVDSNGTYSEGNFTLRLNDHDVTIGGIVFNGTVADTDGALGDGDGFIILENGSNITSGIGSGIEASADAAGEDITITVLDTSSVRSGASGIVANSAAGNVTIVTGTGAGGNVGDGIRALAFGDVTVTAGGVVAGGDAGIRADSATGNVKVETVADATINGGDVGILANSTSGSVTITTGIDSSMEGGGIQATSTSGSISITTGELSSVNGIGAASIAGGAVTITTGANSKADGAIGIAASTTGAGIITITNNGETFGGTAGIEAKNGTGAIQITNNSTGEIRNRSDDIADLAIVTAGGNAIIDNAGIIRGRIETGGGAILTNTGFWFTEGTSTFGGGSDTVNNTFLIFAANDAGAADTTTLGGLETLSNSGGISLTDQKPRDGSNISDTLVIDGDYAGLGNAVLGVDASLGGTDSKSDVLVVGGNTSGVTSIVVNNTSLGAGGLNPDGILVVNVAGTAGADDFVLLGGPIDAGFFVYDLVFNDGQLSDQFLLVSEAGNEVFETLATVAASQEIWRETAGAWEARQQTLRDRLAQGVLVTAVADPALPGSVEPENGLWFSALGSWTARDGEISGFDLDYDQSIYGFVAGADVGIDLGDDSTLLFGVLGGYVDSSLNFDASATSIKTDGATLGLYASLLDGGFFANILVQADLLNLNYSAPSLGPDSSADTDVTSIGGRADIGYRFDTGGLFIEPMLSLEAISTTIDEFSVGGADIDAGTNESFRAGAGLRAGFGGETIRASATGRVWNVFATDNEVAFTSAGPVIALSDDTLEGVYGEVAGQVDVDLSSGTLLFVKGSVLFSDDITKPAVTGGLNFTW